VHLGRKSAVRLGRQSYAQYRMQNDSPRVAVPTVPGQPKVGKYFLQLRQYRENLSLIRIRATVSER
jgi:hypothetical protein